MEIFFSAQNAVVVIIRKDAYQDHATCLHSEFP